MQVWFIEYEVCPIQWDRFKALIPKIRTETLKKYNVTEHQFLLSQEQPYRVVEQLYTVVSLDKDALKKGRTLELQAYLSRKDKPMHIWLFEVLA